MQGGLFWASFALNIVSAFGASRSDADAPPLLLSAAAAAGGCEGDGEGDGGGAGVQARLSWSDVEVGEILGAGSYASVYAARWRGTDVALKCWLRDGIASSSGAAGGDDGGEALALAEARLLMALRHPNVLQVFGILPKPRALVMELAACTLSAALAAPPGNGHPPLTWPRRVELARGVAAGVEFLHALTPPVIHGDLTATNVLLSAAGTPKLSDFGTSFAIGPNSGAALSVCTIEYAAPEVLRRLRVAVPQAVDAYAYGVVLHRLCAPRRTAGERGSRGTFDAGTQGGGGAAAPSLLMAVRAVFAAERSGFQLPLPVGCPPPLALLVRACCDVAPAARPTFGALRVALERAAAVAAEWPERD
jgi:serine/threonine protein kinase